MRSLQCSGVWVEGWGAGLSRSPKAALSFWVGVSRKAPPTRWDEEGSSLSMEVESHQVGVDPGFLGQKKLVLRASMAGLPYLVIYSNANLSVAVEVFCRCD